MCTQKQAECKLEDNLETLELILMDDPVLGDELARVRKIYPQAPVNMIIRVDAHPYVAMLADMEQKVKKEPLVTLVPPQSEPPIESDRFARMEADIRAGTLSLAKIATKYNVSPNTVSGAAKVMGIPRQAKFRPIGSKLTKAFIDKVRNYHKQNPRSTPMEVARHFGEPYDKIVRILTGEMGVGGKYIRAADRANGSRR